MGSETTSSPGSTIGTTDSQQRAGATKSKATIRASLACVPCRSKHVKCDSALPACLRCRVEEKTCYYAKSRRGIRDPKKRSLINDPLGPPPTSIEAPTSFPSPELARFESPINVIDRLPGGWSLNKAQFPSPRTASITPFLFDLYFTNFHDTHPWLLPKPQLLNHIRSEPKRFQFLASCIAYVGSLFSLSISSEELREQAYSLASGGLPKTPWTVQGLLVLSVVAFGENRVDLSSGWIDAATRMALDLEMHKRSFANAEPDLFVAESYRRTYWALYVHGNMRAVREGLPTFTLFATRATIGLPCEEWEYQSGEIPHSMSIEQYDARDPMDDGSFSSWTYLIDLCRLCGDLILPMATLPHELLTSQTDRADCRITRWLLSLPKWKQQLVDAGGAVDMILFHAMAYAHSLRINMRLPMGGGLGFAMRDLLSIGPLFKERGSSTLRRQGGFVAPHQWLEGSTALQAGLSTMELFKFSLPPARYSPACIIGLRRAALPLVDARIYGTVDSPALREKLDLLLSVLKVAGEIWPVAKDIGNEVSDVLRDVDISSHRAKAPHFDPCLDAFINVMSSMPVEDPSLFAFSEPKAAEDVFNWTTGLTATFSI